jgi:hypothetical protein
MLVECLVVLPLQTGGVHTKSAKGIIPLEIISWCSENFIIEINGIIHPNRV